MQVSQKMLIEYNDSLIVMKKTVRKVTSNQ